MPKYTPLQEKYLNDYRKGREYTRLCIAERERYEADPVHYSAQSAPEKIRGHAQVCHENVRLGISNTLFKGIEGVRMTAAYKVCISLGLPRDQPLIELADKALEVYETQQQKKEQ